MDTSEEDNNNKKNELGRAHLGTRTAVTYTINKLPPLSTPGAVLRVQGHTSGSSFATVFKDGFVVFSTRAGVRARVHALRRAARRKNKNHREEEVCSQPVAEIFELSDANILHSTPLNNNNNSAVIAALDSMETLHVWDVRQPPRCLATLHVPYGSPSAMTSFASAGVIVIGYSCGALRCVALDKNNNDNNNNILIGPAMSVVGGGGHKRINSSESNVHSGKIEYLSVCGNTMVAAGKDGVASIWKPTSGTTTTTSSTKNIECAACLHHDEPVACVEVSGDLIVTGTLTQIRMYSNSADSGYRALKVIRCGRDSFPPRRMSLRLAYPYLIVCGGYHEETALSFLDLISGTISARIQTTHLTCAKDFEVLSDGRVLVSSAVEGEGLAIVDVHTPQLVRSALIRYAKRRFSNHHTRLRRAVLAVSAVASLFAAGRGGGIF